jgi:nucleoside-diphosphate-sugar epimerase
MALHTLLGANGTIATELLPILQAAGEKIRLVSRNPNPVDGAETMSADVLDRNQVFRAVHGSDIVYLLVGLKYDINVWRSSWPIIMRNTIDACKATGARLVFFDNVYVYGRVNGRMVESTPFNPCSDKGRSRREIDEMLLSEINSKNIKAIIARAADFYGPRCTDKSATGIMVFERMKKGKAAQSLIDANQLHSYTYTPDAAKGLYMLATTESAYGQTWHLPSRLPALTSREFIDLAAQYMATTGKVQVLPDWLLKIASWFNPLMKEIGEMSYQNKYAYEFDSSKFEKAFQFTPTSYEEGIRQTAAWFLQNK